MEDKTGEEDDKVSHLANSVRTGKNQHSAEMKSPKKTIFVTIKQITIFATGFYLLFNIFLGFYIPQPAMHQKPKTLDEITHDLWPAANGIRACTFRSETTDHHREYRISTSHSFIIY
nr:hypothetical protein [Tanacetum cinerariifolium]